MNSKIEALIIQAVEAAKISRAASAVHESARKKLTYRREFVIRSTPEYKASESAGWEVARAEGNYSSILRQIDDAIREIAES